MKNIHIDCSMGAAGDMLMAALLEVVSDQEQFLSKMNALAIPGVKISRETKETCGICGTHVHVVINGQEEGEHHHGNGHDHHHEHHHHHSGLADVKGIIGSLDLPEKVKHDAMAVYEIIARAESQVHGQDMEHVHFHEVGTLDAIADVVGNCLLMDMIKPDQITASAIHVGSGTVKCAHGILPVPAPATALILQDVPIYGGEIKGELCTPTGAALLKYFVDEFGAMPQMRVSRTGYGVGTKDFGQANCVRVMVGETVEADKNQVCELAANIDDMTAEEIGYAIEVLMEQGALDVYAESIIMKKSRPATKLVCMCKPGDREKMTALLFKHTTTIGIREYRCDRFILERYFEKRATPWGEVDVKVCEGYGTRRAKPEFDQMAKIAREQDISISEIKKEVHG